MTESAYPDDDLPERFSGSSSSAPGTPRQRRHPRFNGRTWWVLLNWIFPLLILSLGIAVLVWFGEAKPSQLPAADDTLAGRMQRLPLAQVTSVRSLDAVGGQLNLSVDGEVVPFREVQLASEVAGQIIYKDPACEAGNLVADGQLLFRIDPTDYRLEVERLAGVREQESQALMELDQETANAQRLLDVAIQDLQLRQGELQRLQSLPEGFASQTELDQASRSRLQALQTKVTAENQRDLLIQQRNRLEAAVRLAATQLEAAQVNLQRTEIRAPIAGVIVREDAELNSFIQRGSPVITIEDTSAAEVAVSLRMDQLYWVLDQQRASSSAPPAINRGYQLPETAATIQYEVAGRDGVVYQWQGKLLRYDGIGLDPQTRTVPVRIVVAEPRRYVRVDNPAAMSQGPTTLVRGMFVRVILHIQPRARLMVIPALALKPGNRIWQFQPDSDVLAGGATVAEAPAGGPEDASAAPQPSAADAFAAADWVPGRVVVLDNVRPIEALEVDGDDRATIHLPRQPTPLPPATDAQYWVCEIADPRLQPGGYVVVTPLSSVGGDAAAAARVPIQQIHPTDVPGALAIVSPGARSPGARAVPTR